MPLSYLNGSHVTCREGDERFAKAKLTFTESIRFCVNKVLTIRKENLYKLSQGYVC
jgi:hypothetical protein